MTDPTIEERAAVISPASCPYYIYFNGGPKGVCQSGCREEPMCVTEEPEGGWEEGSAMTDNHFRDATKMVSREEREKLRELVGMNDTNPDAINCGGLIAGDSNEPVIVVDGRRYSASVIRRVRLDRDRFEKRVAELEAEHDALAAQVAVLREALWDYAVHHPRCDQSRPVRLTDEGNCGLDDILADPAPRAEALLAVVEAARKVAGEEPLAFDAVSAWRWCVYCHAEGKDDVEHLECEWVALSAALAKLDEEGE